MKSERYHRVVAPIGFEGHKKRHPYYCKSKAQADALRWRIRKWKTDRKTPGLQVVEITDYDHNWLGYLKGRLGDLGLIPSVVDHWERTAKRITHPISVTDLCRELIEYRESRGHNQRTVKELRYHVRAFARHCGDTKAHEVTPVLLREFLDSAGTPTLARNHYRALSVLFKFARERGVIVVNPLEEIRRPEGNRTEPGILQPDEFERLLRTADADFPALLPYVAIAGLAGLRSAELVGMYAGEETLQWSDVLWDKGLIQVRPEVAKTTRRKSGDRRYPPIEPALAHWLDPHRKESGSVVAYSESSFRKHFRQLCAAAGCDLAHNALRHSFASYQLARGGKEGVGRLAVIMGNSESVAKRHYVETLEPGEGERWFSIRRQ